MARQSRISHALIALLLLVAASLFAACASDFGEACDFPEANEVDAACEPIGEDDAFCVYKQSEQCESRQCGKYLQSDSFCTDECAEDADCPGDGFCQQLSGGGSEGFCVPGNFRNTQ